MALAYRRQSIVEIFHAHLQTRQKPHPPGLRSASVSEPVESGQAQHRFASWSTATPLSNTCSTNGNGRPSRPLQGSFTIDRMPAAPSGQTEVSAHGDLLPDLTVRVPKVDGLGASEMSGIQFAALYEAPSQAIPDTYGCVGGNSEAGENGRD